MNSVWSVDISHLLPSLLSWTLQHLASSSSSLCFSGLPPVWIGACSKRRRRRKKKIQLRHERRYWKESVDEAQRVEISPGLPASAAVPHATKRGQPVGIRVWAVVKVGPHSVRGKLLQLLLLLWKKKYIYIQISCETLAYVGKHLRTSFQRAAADERFNMS